MLHNSCCSISLLCQCLSAAPAVGVGVLSCFTVRLFRALLPPAGHNTAHIHCGSVLLQITRGHTVIRARNHTERNKRPGKAEPAPQLQFHRTSRTKNTDQNKRRPTSSPLSFIVSLKETRTRQTRTCSQVSHLDRTLTIRRQEKTSCSLSNQEG